MCVTVETGVVRNRKDAEGTFLRKTLGDNFFPTSSGYMACISAGGRNLGGGNPGKALEAFRKLQENERSPGAVTVGDLDPVDTNVTPPQPPRGGMILKVHARMLHRDTGGKLRPVRMEDFPLMKNYKPEALERIGYLFESHPDHAWLLESEWRAMVPPSPKKGDRVPVPDAVARRIARYHLVPTRVYGEGGEWHAKSVRAAELHLTVEEVRPSRVFFRVDGIMKLGSEFNPATATTPNGALRPGYEAEMSGTAVYDREKKVFTRFEMVAPGDVWGRMGDANGRSVTVERPGRNPLAFTFELVSGERPVDRLPPTGRASKIKGKGYFDTGY